MFNLDSKRQFVLIDRAFWLIWLGYPVLIWQIVSDVLDAPAYLEKVFPVQENCIAAVPQVATFSTPGKWVFWGNFVFEFVVYAFLLAIAHQVIHRCAVGKVFVEQMIGSLRLIGLTVAIWPFLSLLLSNLMFAALDWTGDMPFFEPSFGLDLTVLGFGLLLITMATAMRMAVGLHEDAQLTI